MKNLFIVLLTAFLCYGMSAQSKGAGQFSNSSVRKFKEQMQFSDEQSERLDSIFAIHYDAMNAADTAPPVCLRAKDAEIMALLSAQQQAKYDVLKQEWKARQTANKQVRKKKY